MSDDFQPGAAKYGNFIDYYKFNPCYKRLEILPNEFWNHLKCFESLTLCLDVGCNTGELTALLYQKLSEAHCSKEDRSLKFFGIDLDEILIKRANETFENSNLIFICSNVMGDNFKNELSHMLMPFSHNRFDIIFMFSITMWIHLNYGDNGLKKILKLLSESTNYMVLESQPWKCYKTAMRRMRKYKMNHFPEFNKIKMRESVEDDIDKFLISDCGMGKIFESDNSHWGRKIKLFKRVIN